MCGLEHYVFIVYIWLWLVRYQMFISRYLDLTVQNNNNCTIIWWGMMYVVNIPHPYLVHTRVYMLCNLTLYPVSHLPLTWNERGSLTQDTICAGTIPCYVVNPAWTLLGYHGHVGFTGNIILTGTREKSSPSWPATHKIYTHADHVVWRHVAWVAIRSLIGSCRSRGLCGTNQTGRLRAKPRTSVVEGATKCLVIVKYAEIVKYYMLTWYYRGVWWVLHWLLKSGKYLTCMREQCYYTCELVCENILKY